MRKPPGMTSLDYLTVASLASDPICCLTNYERIYNGKITNNSGFATIMDYLDQLDLDLMSRPNSEMMRIRLGHYPKVA